MVLGGLVFGLGTHSLKSDVWLSTREFFDGILWFIVVFGAIATVHVGVVQALSHTPFQVTYDVMDLKMYGVLIGQAEEIIFRGFLLVWLSTLGYPLGPFIGVPASAGAWTLFHLAVYGTQPLGLIVVFMVGIVVGLIAYYKPRLWVFMGAHALVNFVALGGPTLLTMLLPVLLISIIVMLWVSRKRGRG